MRPPTALRQIIKFIIEQHQNTGKYPLNIQIASYFKVSNSRISRATDLLEKKGYIKRRKARIIKLSEHCEDFVKGIRT